MSHNNRGFILTEILASLLIVGMIVTLSVGIMNNLEQNNQRGSGDHAWNVSTDLRSANGPDLQQEAELTQVHEKQMANGSRWRVYRSQDPANGREVLIPVFVATTNDTRP